MARPTSHKQLNNKVGLPSVGKLAGSPKPTSKGVLLLYHTFRGKERNGIIMSKHKCTSIDLVLSGERLRSLIKTNGYSVREIQEILCLSCPQPVYRWFNGTTLPSIDNLYTLSILLNVRMEDLLVFREENTNTNTHTQDEKTIYKKQIVGMISVETFEFLRGADVDFLKKLYRYMKTKI